MRLCWNVDVGRMTYTGSPSFSGLALEDGHAPTFWLLLYFCGARPGGSIPVANVLDQDLLTAWGLQESLAALHRYIHICIYVDIHIYLYISMHAYIHTYINTYNTIHYVTLHDITLHYITLHYITHKNMVYLYTYMDRIMDFLPHGFWVCLGSTAPLWARTWLVSSSNGFG